MKAVIFKGPHNYGVEDIPMPQILDREIMIKVNACGLCGSDLRTLKYGHRKIVPPHIIGHEISGEITQIGSKAQTDWKIGTSLAIAPVVYCGSCIFCRQNKYEFCENYQEIGQAWQGGFAEYIALPENVLSNGVIHPIPSSLSPIQATISEPLSACLHALDRVDFRNVHNAVVFGAGTIGCLLLQLLHNIGVEHITILDPNESRLEIARSFNPSSAIDASNPSVIERVKQITSESGVEVVFTATAAPIAQNQALEVISNGGQIVIFSGLPKDQAKLQVDFNQIHYRNLKLIGTSIYNPDHHQKAIEMIADDTIKVDRIITTYALQDFIKGSQAALDGKIIKAVFVP